MVVDLRIGHECRGSRSDPSLNGQLHHSADLDRSLNESDTDKIRQHRTDYNNRPSHDISFMPDVTSTKVLFHCELGLLIFLQTHRVLRPSDYASSVSSRNRETSSLCSMFDD